MGERRIVESTSRIFRANVHERCVVSNTHVRPPVEIDINVPNPARLYDFWLGGAHNFTSDRLLAARVERTFPGVRDIVRLNRAFLRRAVLFMIDAGIRQFLDIGSGVPTVGNVHEIAQGAIPDCRVVYVDKDPVAVVHSQQLLAGNDKAVAIQADIRDPADIIGRAETRELLNFDEPIGLLNLLVWHFVTDDDDPPGLIKQYRDSITPGSYLAITHLTDDGKPGVFQELVVESVRRGVDEATPRTYEQVTNMFEGFDLIEPGVVPTQAWRPSGPSDFTEEPDANSIFYAGVGHLQG
jgi:SAM-dependent methyltransferase